MTCLKSLNGRICKEVGGCTQASLISYNLQLQIGNLLAKGSCRLSEQMSVHCRVGRTKWWIIDHSVRPVCGHRAARELKWIASFHWLEESNPNLVYTQLASVASAITKVFNAQNIYALPRQPSLQHRAVDLWGRQDRAENPGAALLSRGTLGQQPGGVKSGPRKIQNKYHIVWGVVKMPKD